MKGESSAEDPSLSPTPVTTTPTSTTTLEDSPIACSENNVACIAHSHNLVEYVGDIADVDECRQLCNDEQKCQYLTYYDSTSSPYSEDCYLLSDCDDRVCFGFIIHFHILLILIYLISGGLSGLPFRTTHLLPIVHIPLHWRHWRQRVGACDRRGQ